ncbi:MAG: hypothetical protein LBP71_04000 [Spirochaetaceae bacterium]|nr:hypothetical protein [Spirochaetaceae bacterium]
MVTSEPVPAVVGINTNGRDGFDMTFDGLVSRKFSSQKDELVERPYDLRYDEIAQQHRTARGGLSMFQFINTILEQFLPCFNRQSSRINFCIITIGFIMRPDIQGVSSVISALRIKPERYTTLLKFFRSNAFDIDGLYQKLEAFPKLQFLGNAQD